MTSDAPEAVEEGMRRVAARAERDAVISRRLRDTAAQTGKLAAIQIVGNSGDRRGMYGHDDDFDQ